MVAESSRGTPRIANRILKRVRDWAQVYSDGNIGVDDVRASLEALGIDPTGIDSNDRLYLDTLINKFSGGPVGVDTLPQVCQKNQKHWKMLLSLIYCKRYLNRTAKGEWPPI